MASGQVADSGQQAVAAKKLLPEKDLCFRVGEKAAGEKWFSGAARRYVGKILEIRHISSCGHGSWKRPLELKVEGGRGAGTPTGSHGSWKRPLELKAHVLGSALSRRLLVMGLGKDPLN